MAMRVRACGVLLFLLASCATPAPRPNASAAGSLRLANLQKAATLPWRDDGRCVVREASQSWPLVVERCFQSLDTRRIHFRDTQRRCPVASADVVTLETMVGICLLTQPEIAVGAVLIIGAVVVAVAIQEQLNAYEFRWPYPEEGTAGETAEPATGTQSAEQQSLASRRPKPDGASSGQDWFPPGPPPSPEPHERRLECTPRPVPHLGGDALHNLCADKVPKNEFPGSDVLVNGKRFDALQLRQRLLWEVKTDNFDTYPTFLRTQVIENQLPELQRERTLAKACGFDFRIGVSSAAHRDALRDRDITLNVVVMDWC
ncbi:hypothetical protein D7Y13_12735 [Corallococcus praedator]|uniref:DUF6310 domain-containing protein n=1 Tax=Corallococcus praedator TaxID=2316724 RepID=A0ABX9QKY1_9BACT|nr:hypothetical protein D7X75_07500 [Corallococcus sp. CA031C]RKI10376.1 hypothetical protein D7Y13_12735 [Corallococcus praedator]